MPLAGALALSSYTLSDHRKSTQAAWVGVIHDAHELWSQSGLDNPPVERWSFGRSSETYFRAVTEKLRAPESLLTAEPEAEISALVGFAGILAKPQLLAGLPYRHSQLQDVC